MKKHLSNIILVLILLTGVSLLLYPTVSDYWNSFHQSRAIASYTDAVASMDDEEYEKMWEQAASYNLALWYKPNRFSLSEEDWAEYESLLNIYGKRIMGDINNTSIYLKNPI